MVSCCVVGCNNRSSRKKDIQKQKEKESTSRISYHKFPEDPTLRQIWIDAISRNDWVPTKNSLVCSDHFFDDCLDVSAFHTKLSRTAVPTIFPVDYNKQLSEKSQGQDKDREITYEDVFTDAPSASTQEPESESEELSESAEIEKNVTLTNTQDTLRHKLSSDQINLRRTLRFRAKIIKKCKHKLSSYESKIHDLQQINRRQAKTIEKLQKLLTKSNHNFVDDEFDN